MENLNQSLQEEKEMMRRSGLLTKLIKKNSKEIKKYMKLNKVSYKEALTVWMITFRHQIIDEIIVNSLK